MTREEAINKWVVPAIRNTWNDKKCEEIIKALEQEFCEEAISRKDALNAIKNFCNECDADYCGECRMNYPGKDVRNVFESLPLVTPQPKYEDIAKAFQLGMAFGFGEKHDEMDKVVEEIKAFAPQPKMGKWIMHRGYNADGFGIEYSCSECKEWEEE